MGVLLWPRWRWESLASGPNLFTFVPQPVVPDSFHHHNPKIVWNCCCVSNGVENHWPRSFSCGPLYHSSLCLINLTLMTPSRVKFLLWPRWRWECLAREFSVCFFCFQNWLYLINLTPMTPTSSGILVVAKLALRISAPGFPYLAALIIAVCAWLISLSWSQSRVELLLWPKWRWKSLARVFIWPFVSVVVVFD